MISDSQAITWSHQGAIQSSADTYNSIKGILQANFSNPIDIYLQGSYKNHTNTYGTSDVDIVIENKTTFFQNSIYLSDNDRQLLNQYNVDSNYDWLLFHNEILSILQSAYGYHNVTSGDKSIKIQRGNGRMPADVIVCFEHRKYFSFSDTKKDDFLHGIAFRSLKSNELIVNYPDMHYFLGVDKNSEKRTNGIYKPVIRVLKNARTSMQTNGFYTKPSPSYFIECLLYNVPDESFVPNLRDSLINILAYLIDVDFSKMKCQNQITDLFGTNIGQWNIPDAKDLIIALIKFLFEG